MANMNTHQALMAAIRRVSNFVKEDAFNNITLEAATARLERLEERWTRFNQTYEEMVEAVEGNDIQTLEASMEIAEERYFDAKAALRAKITQLQPQQAEIVQ